MKNTLQNGRISEVRKNFYKILPEEGSDLQKEIGNIEIPAKLRGSFYGDSPENLPVVGDYVTFEYNPLGDSMICSVRERTSFLQRPDQAKTGVMQYMVANADYAFIVTSLNEDYSYNRIARYASVALQGGAVPVVILTKSDLCPNVGRFVTEVETISEEVRVHAISALYGIGLEELQQYFVPGKTIVLLGSSGAGKSTLVNTLAGREIMRTGGIREEDSKGRHTTTHRELIELDGISFIDTPGLRELGMIDAEEGIDSTFSDIAELITRCAFSDCTHGNEPGCAVRQALENGTLTPERWKMFSRLEKENSWSKIRKNEKMMNIAMERRKLSNAQKKR